MSAVAHTTETRAPKPIAKTVKLVPNHAGDVPKNDEQPEKRKQILRALRAHGEVIIDFADVRQAARTRTRRLLLHLWQMATTVSPEEGGQARLINLCEPVSTMLEKQLCDWSVVTVIDREFAHSAKTRTTYASEMVLRLHAWARDPAKAELLEMLFARDGDSCVWCGRALTSADRLATLDHVLPRSAGGCDHTDNFVVACAACNRRRGNCDAEEFLAQCLGSAHHQVNERAVRAAVARSEALHASGVAENVISLSEARCLRLREKERLRRSMTVV